MDGRGSGWLRALAILVLVVVIGGIGYTVGLANAGATVASGAAPVVYAPWGFGFGFGFFGLLFPILFIGLLFLAFSGRSRRGRGPWGGYGSYRGPGPDGRPWAEGQDVPPPFEPMLESWHRRAHGSPPQGPDSEGAPRSGS